VEIGRAVYINYGKDQGKLAVILDIVNENRVLINKDNIQTGIVFMINLGFNRGSRLRCWTSSYSNQKIDFDQIQSPSFKKPKNRHCEVKK